MALYNNKNIYNNGNTYIYNTRLEKEYFFLEEIKFDIDYSNHKLSFYENGTGQNKIIEFIVSKNPSFDDLPTIINNVSKISGGDGSYFLDNNFDNKQINLTLFYKLDDIIYLDSAKRKITGFLNKNRKKEIILKVSINNIDCYLKVYVNSKINFIVNGKWINFNLSFNAFDVFYRNLNFNRKTINHNGDGGSYVGIENPYYNNPNDLGFIVSFQSFYADLPELKIINDKGSFLIKYNQQILENQLVIIDTEKMICYKNTYENGKIISKENAIKYLIFENIDSEDNVDFPIYLYNTTIQYKESSDISAITSFYFTDKFI